MAPAASKTERNHPGGEQDDPDGERAYPGGEQGIRIGPAPGGELPATAIAPGSLRNRKWNNSPLDVPA
jgi:hypothetical protein